MKEIELKFKVRIYQSTDELPEYAQNLIFLAREAAKRAYAPYSGYHVGASVLLDNGELITGNNQENAAYPSGLCAERTALFYASSRFPKIAVRAMAVSTLSDEMLSVQNLSDETLSEEKLSDGMVSGGMVSDVTLPGNFAKPCGSCRQVIAEYEDLAGTPIEIILDGSSAITVVNGVDTLLPFRFKKEDLGKKL